MCDDFFLSLSVSLQIHRLKCTLSQAKKNILKVRPTVTGFALNNGDPNTFLAWPNRLHCVTHLFNKIANLMRHIFRIFLYSSYSQNMGMHSHLQYTCGMFKWSSVADCVVCIQIPIETEKTCNFQMYSYLVANNIQPFSLFSIAELYLNCNLVQCAPFSGVSSGLKSAEWH